MFRIGGRAKIIPSRRTSMDNIMRIVALGVCTGCGACGSCEHISFMQNQYGVPAPTVDDQCTSCGKCIELCIYDPNREDD